MAKSTIVIRSVIVPVANVASNVLQLMAFGVPLRDIQNGFKTKLVEINQHLANEARRVEIGAEMAQHKPKSVAYRKLEAELKSLEDANKRMTIWPLTIFKAVYEWEGKEIDAAPDGRQPMIRLPPGAENA